MFLRQRNSQHTSQLTENQKGMLIFENLGSIFKFKNLSSINPYFLSSVNKKSKKVFCLLDIYSDNR